MRTVAVDDFGDRSDTALEDARLLRVTDHICERQIRAVDANRSGATKAAEPRSPESRNIASIGGGGRDHILNAILVLRLFAARERYFFRVLEHLIVLVAYIKIQFFRFVQENPKVGRLLAVVHLALGLLHEDSKAVERSSPRRRDVHGAILSHNCRKGRRSHLSRLSA